MALIGWFQPTDPSTFPKCKWAPYAGGQATHARTWRSTVGNSAFDKSILVLFSQLVSRSAGGDPVGKMPNHVYKALSLHPWSLWTQEQGLIDRQIEAMHAPQQLDEGALLAQSSEEALHTPSGPHPDPIRTPSGLLALVIGYLLVGVVPGSEGGAALRASASFTKRTSNIDWFHHDTL